MDSINDRFRFLRESCDKNQTEWAEILGLSRSGVSEIEAGRRNVTDKHIKLLSVWTAPNGKKINIEWLRNGTGDPFLDLDRDIQIETFIGNVLRDESDNFKRRLISALCNLSEDEWEFLERKLREIVGTDENGTG